MNKILNMNIFTNMSIERWKNTLNSNTYSVYAQPSEYDFYIDPKNPDTNDFISLLKQTNSRDLTFVLGGTKNSVCEKYKKYGKVKYWSNYHAYYLTKNLHIETYLKILESSNITIPFTFYVRKPKYFREYLYNILCKEDVLQYSDWSFNNAALDKDINVCNNIHTQRDPHSVSVHIHPSAYNNSFLDVACETYNGDYEKYYITEKTWRSILWGKPFLIVGVSGINRYLKSMGFELFEEIIDYSFDEELDMKRRMQMISKEIIKLCNSNYNFNELYYNVLYPKINHNRNLLINDVLEDKYVPVECLDYPAFSTIIKHAKEKTCILRNTI